MTDDRRAQEDAAASPDERPDAERRDAERLRRYLAGEGGPEARPTAAEGDAVGVLGGAPNQDAVDIDTAWARVRATARPVAPRRSVGRAWVSLAAAVVLIAAGVLSARLIAPLPATVPAPTVAELTLAQGAVAGPEMSLDERLEALSRAAASNRARLVERLGDGG